MQNPINEKEVDRNPSLGGQTSVTTELAPPPYSQDDAMQATLLSEELTEVRKRTYPKLRFCLLLEWFCSSAMSISKYACTVITAFLELDIHMSSLACYSNKPMPH